MRFKRLTVTFLLVMFAVVLVVEPVPVHAASSLVQQAMALMVQFGGNPTPGQTISASFPSNVASGNVIVAAVASGDANSNPPATVSSVSDSRGSSFTEAVHVTNTVNAHAYIYYATLSSSGLDTVTVTFTSDLSDYNGMAYLFIYEVSGVKTTGVATATGIGWSSGSVSTSSSISFESGAFLVAIMGGQTFSSSWAAGSGFQFSPTHPYDIYAQLAKGMYSTSGVFSPTNFPATLSPNQNWVEAAIALSPATTLRAEDPVSHLNALDVTVGSIFSVDIWIRGIPPADPMDSFSFDLAWDPAFMQYDHSQGNPPSGWNVDVDDASAASGTLTAGGIMLQNGNPYSDDHMWLSVYFHCLKSGVDTIAFSGASWMDDVGGFQLSFDSVLSATVSQTGGSTPNPYHYVGGELFSANKLAVLGPYLALFSIVAVAAIVVKRKLT